jgi:hypothetical protein
MPEQRLPTTCSNGEWNYEGRGWTVVVTENSIQRFFNPM